MPLDEDKYPAETGRRRFVSGVVGSAALSAVGVGGAAAADSLTSSSGEGGGTTTFVAVQNTDGPAPRGMPIIPITIDGGTIKGVWPEYDEEAGVAIARDFGGSGIDYSSAWFQYCGVQTSSGIYPQAEAENAFLNSQGAFDWQSDVGKGEPLTVDMFDDYESWGNGIGSSGLGKPASATWRQTDKGGVTAQIIRSKKVEEMANGNTDLPGPVQDFIAEATDQGFIAWLNKCTHFCCVPGFKTQEGSANFGAENAIYCQCHQSVYDPFSPVQKQFVALPRPPQTEG
ncbi:Rieske 2Fe-2S domain-containing protein [Haloarcula salinisoli]|uniref:Rieske 2Fe-2S domain-containing protein n=1 Tax=Haloarcula salinisoli TaxID=2487746 RepID=A0A8J7YAV0_9EURY|nr:Rieske 2Fe-2S domain-containing protein [Halomicroarcula salinisoli]MBX0285852.1 Rieske 2Fe-2S domain-containing protein [Halomicroarcula salinisoli]MBX0302655.1 Rieske 2Fe-2S domain-containing protein [Halomicroarcula salinisoli]